MVPVHDSITHPQSYTAAFFPFGSEEWLEQMLARALWNAAASVKHNNQHSRTARANGFAVTPDMHPQLASSRHGFHCVDNKVRENLSQFRRESRNLSLPIVTFLDLDFLRANLLAVEQHDSVDQLDQIHRHHGRCLSVHGKSLLCDLSHTVKFLVYQIELLSLPISQPGALPD
jgi:hypothetical protein